MRYEPAATVTHPRRPDLTTWLRQRFDYGAPPRPWPPGTPRRRSRLGLRLERMPPGRSPPPASPVLRSRPRRCSSQSARQPRKHPWQEGLRLAGGGGTWEPGVRCRRPSPAPGGLQPWLSHRVRRARRAVVAAALVPPIVDWFRGERAVDPAAYVALRLLDDVAYGAGVWAGCARARTVVPLVPDLTSWPGRRPAVD